MILIIIISLAYYFPCFSNNSQTNSMERKRRGEHSATYPSHQAFALPSIEISNSASPRRWVLSNNYAERQMAFEHKGIIHLTWTLCCGIFRWIKFAKFDDLKITFKNALSCSIPCFLGLTMSSAMETYSNMSRPSLYPKAG